MRGAGPNQQRFNAYAKDLMGTSNAIRNDVVNTKILPLVLSWMQDPRFAAADVSIATNVERFRIWKSILEDNKKATMNWVLSPFASTLVSQPIPLRISRVLTSYYRIRNTTSRWPRTRTLDESSNIFPSEGTLVD